MNINGLFAHTLTDLIRGIRQNKKNEQGYIAKEIADIRLELRRNDPDLKAQAIAKLTYLQMMGYDMSWASFHVVEVMSSPKFLYKGIGYLGAVQSFNQETDVLMLTTNLIKKDLASANASEIGIAINGLSHILTPDLARDLCADLVAMLNHSRPIVRKKVLLVLYKVFLKYPEGLRLSFSRMKDRLEDPDPSVVSAAVNVICELARRNPKNYLSLAPQLFKLLTTSSNNWMLIKIIKLFAALTPYEPRLTKKLLPPITTLIQTTPAMSLLYECIHTVIAGGMLATTGSGSNAESANMLAATCVTKLRTFLEDPDQNLKYIGLLALTKILPTHPHLVAEHKDIILKCIDDPDISIRMRTLDLIVGMANKKNLTEIVKRLISHLLPINENEVTTSSLLNNGAATAALMDPSYRADIIRRIIFICSQNSYANITNFEWYLAVLSDLTNIAGVNVGESLMQQFMDVGVRVKSARSYTVQLMTLTEPTRPEDSNSMVLLAAAWLTGEYCALLENPETALELLAQKSTSKLDPAIQATYLQTMLKIFAYWMNSLQYSWNEEARQSLVEMVDLLREGIKDMFSRSPDLEVQERASNIAVILDIIAEHVPRTPLKIANSISFSPTMPKPPAVLGSLYPLFFNQELNPVAPKAQKKVPVPEGLDLDSWIHEPVPEQEPESSDDDDFLNERQSRWGEEAVSGKSKKKGKKGRDQEDTKESAEAKARRKAERRERQKHDPYYIGGGSDSPKSQKKSQDDLDVDSIPIVQLSMDGFAKPIVMRKKDKSSKKKSKRREQSRSPPVIPVEFAVEEMPEDATLSASEDESSKKAQGRSGFSGSNGRGILDQDASALHEVDLSVPVGEDEHLPRAKPYMKPEEVRQYEDELAQRRRVEALQAKKDSKKSKKSKESTGEGEGEKKKKKSSKKSKAKEEPLITLDAPVVAKSPTPERPRSVEPPAPVEAAAVAKEPKSKKSSKSSSKSKKSSTTKSSTTSKKTPKAPVIVAFPERSNVELALDDNLALTYDIALAQISLDAPTAPGSEPESEPTVSIQLRMHNRNLTQPISSIRATLADSFDVRLGGAQAGEDSVRLSTSSIEPQGSASMTMDLLILGRVRYELRVMGTLYYEVNGHEESIEYNFAVPPSSFMLAIPRLTGADFSKILTEQLEAFSATGSATVQLSSGTTGQDEVFWDAVEKITKEVTHTHVVEVVDGAASFFGQSWQGYQVAGLIKVNKGADTDGSGSKTIEVEMKCTDQTFVDGLAKEILDVEVY
ncbi:AP-3 complex subunit delta [Linnemannia schmuckeri]|uniref:AP-3 complex subunit delta n=1 Tax=Linnemannia schmuckeri TaxID=64567 RepID=A0A9P5VDM2_9FUNG|nr:AP-3 complex subunit delta [Linnemannia schmuckeri]